MRTTTNKWIAYGLPIFAAVYSVLMLAGLFVVLKPANETIAVETQQTIEAPQLQAPAVVSKPKAYYAKRKALARNKRKSIYSELRLADKRFSSRHNQQYSTYENLSNSDKQKVAEITLQFMQNYNSR